MGNEIEKLEKKNKASQQPTVEQLQEMVANLTHENHRATGEVQLLKERLKGAFLVSDRLRDDIVWMVDKFRSTDEADFVKQHEQRLMQQAAKR